jgi:alpha-1,6-mannosyl-glycoprotein beta-1,2-N-acetylglucosaminyltransferase
MVEDGHEWFGEYSGMAARVICTHAAQALLPHPTHPAPRPPRRLEFPPGTIPIVFYVHSRPEYFEQSTDALASAAGVAETIIVISHDGLYPEMDAIVNRLSARLKLASRGKHAGVYQLVHNQCEGSYRNNVRRHNNDMVLKVKAHWWWMMVRPID